MINLYDEYKRKGAFVNAQVKVKEEMLRDAKKNVLDNVMGKEKLIELESIVEKRKQSLENCQKIKLDLLLEIKNLMNDLNIITHEIIKEEV